MDDYREWFDKKLREVGETAKIEGLIPEYKVRVMGLNREEDFQTSLVEDLSQPNGWLIPTEVNYPRAMRPAVVELTDPSGNRFEYALNPMLYPTGMRVVQKAVAA